MEVSAPTARKIASEKRRVGRGKLAEEPWSKDLSKLGNLPESVSVSVSCLLPSV